MCLEWIGTGSLNVACQDSEINAAARFFDFLVGHAKELGFESSPLLPSLFRHTSKILVMCSHVDDIIVSGERCEVIWLVSEIEQ